MAKRRSVGTLLIVGLLAAALTPLPSRAAEAPPIHLIKDLSVSPAHHEGSQPDAFTRFGSRMLFNANDGVVGFEPWITDGTLAGTTLLKDVEPGGEHSYPFRFTVVGSTAYFFTYSDATELYALWKTDGTSAGTLIVKSGLYDAQVMQPVGSTLYFFEGDSQTTLWKSDGTPGGTVAVKTFDDGLLTIRAVEFDSKLFFSGNVDDYGYELWTSEGTEETTQLFKDIVTGSGAGDPEEFTVIGDTMYFRAFEPTQSYRTLWKTDGDPDTGTVVVEDPMTTGPRNAEDLVAAGNQVYFIGNDATNGDELWVSDGSVDGTQVIEEITPGDGASLIYDMAAVGDTVYFLNDNGGAAELWSSGGTALNTTLLDEVAPGGDADNLTAGDDEVFLSADDGTNGRELWRSPGGVGNAAMVVDLAPGAVGSDPTSLAIGDAGKLYFSASADFGTEPYVSTGADDDATLLRDIHPPSSDFGPDAFVRAGSNLYFPYDDGVNGTELWKTNGTAAGTVMVEDIFPGDEGSNPSNLAEMNGILYFAANNGTQGIELWRSDGTEVGTYRLEDIYPGPSGIAFQQPTRVGNKLYFTAYAPDTGLEVYVTDGAIAGADLVKDIALGLGEGSNPDQLTAVGSELWFTVPNGDLGETGIYRTNGTEVGTIQVTDELLGGSKYVPFNGNVYFHGYGPHAGELYKSNGSEAGTLQLSHQGGFNVRDLTVMGNALYFLGNEDGNNEKPRLYKTTGTEASTTPLTPLAVDSLSDLRKVGNRLVFSALDANGREPWRSDGTAAGTGMLKNLGPGNGIPEDPWYTVIGKALFFSGRDATHGEELWISDGTSANTFMVQDFNTRAGTRPAHIAALGNQVIFSGLTDSLGRELLGLTSPRATKLTLKVAKKRRKLNVSGKLNLAHAGAQITVTLFKKVRRRYKKVGTKKPASKATGAYATSFTRPRARRCKLTATYGGHVDHSPATKRILFRC